MVEGSRPAAQLGQIDAEVVVLFASDSAPTCFAPSTRGVPPEQVHPFVHGQADEICGVRGHLLAGRARREMKTDWLREVEAED